jgi:hypothetical protein
MKLLTVPAARGVHWMRGGFRVFMKQPLAFTALFMAFLFAVMVLLSLPSFGGLLGLVLMPAATVGFVLASETIEAGRTPSPAVLVAGLRGPRARRVAMLQVGLAYALCAFVTAWLADVIDGGFYERMADYHRRMAEFLAQADAARTAPPGIGVLTVEGDAARATAVPDPAQPGPAEMQPPSDELVGGLLLRLLLPIPLTLVFWHAPVIVYRTGVGAAKAVFASAVACWRNLPAFAVYGLSWVVLLMLSGLLTLALLSLVGQQRFAVVLSIPAVLMFSTAFYASLYFTVVDCFDFGADPRPD